MLRKKKNYSGLDISGSDIHAANYCAHWSIYRRLSRRFRKKEIPDDNDCVQEQ